MATDSVLDLDAVRMIRKAMLVGLASFGEIERLRNECKINDEVGESTPAPLRPVHPTGDADTTGDFATALALIDVLERAYTRNVPAVMKPRSMVGDPDDSAHWKPPVETTQLIDMRFAQAIGILGTVRRSLVNNGDLRPESEAIWGAEELLTEAYEALDVVSTYCHQMDCRSTRAEAAA